jgi:hypothetical protein
MGQDSQQGGKPSQSPQQQHVTRPVPPKPAPLQPVTITKGGWEKPGQSEKH